MIPLFIQKNPAHYPRQLLGQSEYQNLPKTICFLGDKTKALCVWQGGVIHPNCGPKPLPCNPATEELEVIISILMQADEKVAKRVS